MGGGAVCWWERPCCDKRLQVGIPSRVSFNTRATFKEVCVKRSRIETYGRLCAKSCVSSKKREGTQTQLPRPETLPASRTAE